MSHMTGQSASGISTPVPSVVKYGGLSNLISKPKDPEVEVTEITDPEKGSAPGESLDRPLHFTSAIVAGLAIILMTFLMFGVAMSKLLQQSLIDHSYVRFALVRNLICGCS
jgi:hypothetical protein